MLTTWGHRDPSTPLASSLRSRGQLGVAMRCARDDSEIVQARSVWDDGCGYTCQIGRPPRTPHVDGSGMSTPTKRRGSNGAGGIFVGVPVTRSASSSALAGAGAIPLGP